MATTTGSGAPAKPSRTTAPLKVDSEVDQLISDGAHFLGLTKKDLVAEAVRVYLELRREEIRSRMMESMRKLDGSNLARDPQSWAPEPRMPDRSLIGNEQIWSTLMDPHAAAKLLDAEPESES